jgi:CxxC motif-containing protein (DUF1111 family)
MPRQSLLEQQRATESLPITKNFSPAEDLGLDMGDQSTRNWLLEPLTCKGAAAELNTTTNALATYRSRNRGPAYIKHGGKVMYRRLDLLAYQQAGRVEPCE